MTADEIRRIRRAHDQAVLDEESYRLNAADTERELSGVDPDYQPRRHAYLRALAEELRRQQREAADRVDALRPQVRDLPPVEPPHPDGAAAAIRERDRRPMQWNVGGSIGERDKAWEAPLVPPRPRGQP